MLDMLDQCVLDCVYESEPFGFGQPVATGEAGFRHIIPESASIVETDFGH